MGVVAGHLGTAEREGISCFPAPFDKEERRGGAWSGRSMRGRPRGKKKSRTRVGSRGKQEKKNDRGR